MIHENIFTGLYKVFNWKSNPEWRQA